MRLFGAMLIDSYRELNSKKLFWVILVMSATVVLMYGSIGFDETGMSMFFGLTHVENALLTDGSFLASLMYRSIFSTFMVGVWLAWIATILALVSTTTVFPDFVSGGAIDLVLSKPIRRVTLFFMKYMASLLFVLLQVTLFCVGVFLCMGIRLGDWEWKIFAAIPVVMLFFSYLFSVNVLFGVWTRSALAALLITMMLWTSLWSVNQAETILNLVRMEMIVGIEGEDKTIATLEESYAALETGEAEQNAPAMRRIKRDLESRREERDSSLELIGKIDNWYKPIRTVRTIMPKTAETIALLDRWLRRDTDVNLFDLLQGKVASNESGGFSVTNTSDKREAQRRLQHQYDAKSEVFLIGSSLAFEVLVLSFACWIFVRRDY